MKTAEAPFPFTSMFQNGPRRQGSAPQTLFKPGKDFPPPRKNRAPLPAPGRSENLALEKGKGANAKPKPFSVRSLLPPPFGRHRRHPVMLTRPRNPKIRSPPLDDVNNLRHHCKCQRRFASTAIQIRRNALFTSSEYASTDLTAYKFGGVHLSECCRPQCGCPGGIHTSTCTEYQRKSRMALRRVCHSRTQTGLFMGL